MATNKYQIKEFTPTANQVGMGHSVYADAVVDNVITNKELAKKIALRGISRPAEIKSVLEEAANIIMEEVMENNRVQLEGEDGILVSIAPSVSGKLSDKDVRENPDKYAGATVATPDMLTADMLQWGIKAEVGRKFSKQFAMNKTAQRVNGGTPASIAEGDGSSSSSEGGNGSQSDGNGNGSGDNGGDNSGNMEG